MVSDSDVAAVRQSYGRVIAKGGFIDRFYEIFLSSSPEIGKMFSKTDFKKQSELLEQSLTMAVLFPQRNPIAKQVVDRIRLSHSHNNLNISPALYRFWLDSLIKAVAERDPKFDAGLERQWRSVLQVTLAHIIEGY